MIVTLIKILLEIIFTLSIVGKLTGKTKATFENSGYSPKVMYGTAIAEIVLAVGLFSRFEIFSIFGLLAIMAGAIFTLYQQKVKPAKYILALVTVTLLIALFVIQNSISL